MTKHLPRTSARAADALSETSRPEGVPTVELQEAKEALRMTEAKYGELVQNANSIILQLDTQGRVTFLNEFAQRFFGYSEDEIVGQSSVGTIVPEQETSGRDLAALIQDIGQNPEQYRNNENENMRKDGRRVWVAWTNKAIRDDAGRVTEILCIGNDITQRKRIEEALARERDLLQALMDNVPDMIFFKDAQSRFIRTNRAHAEFLGLADPQEAVGKTDFDLFPTENAPAFYAEEQAIIRSGQPIVDRVGQTPDTRAGELRWFSETKTPLRDERGQVVGLACIARDITERKRMEANLERHSAQLRTAAEVSRAVTSILDPDELIQRVVDLVCERFDLYYAGLFLVDEAGERSEWSDEAGTWAVLRAGSGEAGRHMLAAGHKLKIGGESMIGWCVANRQARIALDVGEESVRFDNPWLPETRSEMALPLISRGKVIGAMTIQSTKAAAFSQEDISVLQTMADQLANAIQNAHLFDQQLQRSQEMATLNQIAATVNRSLNMQELLEATLATVAGALGFEAGLISLGDKETGQLVLAYHLGLDREIANQLERKGLKDTLCHLVFESEKTLSIPDIEQGAPVDVGGLLKHGLHAYVGVPLIYQSQLLGTMCLFSRAIRNLSAAKLSLLEAIGHQIGVGIQNAYLLAETEKALQEARSVHQQYLRQEWESFLTSQENGVGAGYLLTPQGLQATPRLWSPEIDLAMQSQQPVIVTDSQRPTTDVGGPPYQARSALAAPITLRGQVIGALDIFDPDKPREWTEDDLALIDAVTSQAALAVENARLFQKTQSALAEIERRANDMAMLFDISRSLAGAPLQSEEIAFLVTRQFVEVMKVPGCSLSLYDPQRQQLRVAAASNSESGVPSSELTRYSELLNSTYRLSDYPATARVMKTLQPLVVQAGDPEADPDELAAMRHSGVATLAIIPLSVKGQAIGIIELETFDKEHRYTTEELNLSLTLANQAAVALENARLYEDQHQTAERLREVDKFKTQFLANMSHELRTPLNSIIGFSRVILKGIDGPLTALQQTDLTAIYNSGQHLLGLINDILDLSKIEAGKMELNFDQVDLRPIIKGVLSTAVGLVKDKSIELEHIVAEDLPTIWADSTRVRQVLLNLMSNATKFTENGKISLTAEYDGPEQAEKSGTPQQAGESRTGWVTIRVSDTGTGIPAEKLDSIFEEFIQVDGSTTRSVGGTGLGLPISRHFVEMHGGTISVESQEGVGSTFTVRLPIHGPVPAEASTPDQGEDETPSGDRRVILAVDNDPGVLSLYRRYLDGEGFQVIGITESSAVLERAVELQPFAITLDILMPGKDGWQVLRELKECPETRHIPILICSIVRNEGLGFSLGAADYLVKPIMEEELVAALARLDTCPTAGAGKRTGEANGRQATVLIIDDQADDILLIRRILEAQHDGQHLAASGEAASGEATSGYRVIEASGGQAGIDSVHEYKPDIIILDLLMPEVDGFAVLEALKRDPSTRHIPVVVITAKELGEEERERLMGQVEVLLQKGLFTETELLEDLKYQISNIKYRMANAEQTRAFDT